MKQSLRIALEFVRWYDFKTGKATFREFADSVLAELVLNGATPKTVEIRVFGHEGLTTTEAHEDDYRWAFGRLLEGQAKARVDGYLVIWFQEPNWLRITTQDGDMSKSRCIRKAAVTMRKRANRPTIVDFDRITKLLEDTPGWYEKGSRREYRGQELADRWILMDTLMGVDLEPSGLPHVTSTRHHYNPGSGPGKPKERDFLAD